MRYDPIRIGAHRAEGTDDLAQICIRKQPFGVGVEPPQAIGCGGVGCGKRAAHAAEQQIAFGGGNGGDALSAAFRLMEDHQGGLLRQLVQHQIIRRVQIEPDRRRKQQLLYLVSSSARAVDHGPAGKFCPVGLYHISGGCSLNPEDPVLYIRLTAVVYCVFKSGNAQQPRIYRAGGWGVQGRRHLLRQHRLHGPGFLTGEQVKLRHAVFSAVPQFFL